MRIPEASIDRVLTLVGSVNEDIESAIAEVYSEVGRDVVTGIRDGTMSDWLDQTGALRSSIGCVVARKGSIIYEFGFEAVLNGAEGATKGRELARKLAEEYADKDFCLIIVAGEKYAVYVEAVEGKSVLAQGQLYVQSNITRLLKERINEVLSKYEN